MIRASNSTTYGLGAALAAFALVAPAATPVIAQEVRAAAETNCAKVADKDLGRCIIERHQQRMDEFARKTEQARREGEQARREGEQARREGERLDVVIGCKTYLSENMDKKFTREEFMAKLGNPKTKEEFAAALNKQACDIARGYKYTGRTAQLERQP